MTDSTAPLIEQLQITYVEDGRHMHIQFHGKVRIEEVETIEAEPISIRQTFQPQPTKYRATLAPERSAEGTVYSVMETPDGIWSEKGIHMPTMEAVDLVLTNFVGLDEDVMQKFREAVLGGGPL